MKSQNRTQRAGPGHKAGPHRRNWVILVLVALCMLPDLASARVIAVIKSKDQAAYNAPLAAFARSVEGRVVTFDMEGDLKKGQQIAEQLAQVPPDLILALGEKAAYTARKYVTNVPIIYTMVINPEKYGLNQPNVTGITVEVPPETAFTQFRMFAPDITRVGVIYSAATEDMVHRAEKAVAGLGIRLVGARVGAPGEVGDAFDKIRDSIDSLWMVPDSGVLNEDTFRLLLNRTKARKIPYLAFSENFVKAGAFMSVSPSYETIGSQAAAIARQILDDKVSPSAIPVAPPIGTHLIINADTARALELKLDPLILAFADEVIGAVPGQGNASTRP